MTSRDPESLICEGFEGAFGRMLQASSSAETEIELTNCLHHMYRLSELKKTQGHFVNAIWVPKLLTVPGAAGAIWSRKFDTHQIFQISELSDQYSDYFTQMFGVPRWLSSATFNSDPDNLGRDADYETHLANRVVPDTLRRAYDGLLELT